jgi:isopentenyl diphosphate isomerase/L-lactate dehydrogenase-like FMN-dependent dehydrogenase
MSPHHIDFASRRRLLQFLAGGDQEQGVERVLGVLRAETRTSMQQLGAPSLKALTPAMVRRA